MMCGTQVPSQHWYII